MDEGIGLAMALTVPAAAALLIAPTFLVDGIFTRGAFKTEDAAQSGLALVHYAWGVPAFVLIKVLAPAFFAREDMKTPMRYALVSVAVNTVLGAGLFFWLQSEGHFGFPGLAIATSIAAWVNVLLLGSTLLRRGWYRPSALLVDRMVRVTLAVGAMCGALLIGLANLDLIRSFAFDSKFFTMVTVILGAMIAYGIAALLFGAVRLNEIFGALKRS